ncbi:sensor histidine kinase [Idiomarina tyrosinivorans]|nr:HAMP domain-containing sensor histidine kinase [Idiomarina tyrosinivorans]
MTNAMTHLNGLDAIINAMPNAVLVLDLDGRVQLANAHAEQLLEGALAGELWRDLVTRRFAPRADDGHEVSLRSGRRVRLDISSLDPQPGQLIVMTDLTETRKLQARLSHLQRLSSMGKMVASLAHQIRTPLSAAMLYAHNLKLPQVTDEKRQQFVDKLQNRLQTLEHQVNDMLLFAKSGDQPVLERLSVKQLFEHCLGHVEAYAQQRQVHLQVECSCQDTPLQANLTALSGAIQNLITNAVDASEPGASVTLRIDKEQQQLWLYVIDHGCGMDAAVQEQIFTPFFTGKSHGTGLGLAVVRSVVQSHQGQISVTSKPQQGTTFTLQLPLLADKDEVVEEIAHYG